MTLSKACEEAQLIDEIIGIASRRHSHHSWGRSVIGSPVPKNSKSTLKDVPLPLIPHSGPLRTRHTWSTVLLKIRITQAANKNNVLPNSIDDIKLFYSIRIVATHLTLFGSRPNSNKPTMLTWSLSRTLSPQAVPFNNSITLNSGPPGIETARLKAIVPRT